MERRFQYYVPFTNHTQYRARAREHNNTVQRISNYMRLHEHACLLNSCPPACTYIRIFILKEAKKVSKCAVTYERSVFS